jgi:hypothetical protein
MAVVLPTGEVALFGGAATAVEFSDATAVLTTGVLAKTWCSILLLSCVVLHVIDAIYAGRAITLLRDEK